MAAVRSHCAGCVQARVKNKTGSLVSKEYSLDRLGAKQVMRLPTAKSPTGSSDNLAQGSIPAELQEKVASLLASESSRKVSVLPTPCRAVPDCSQMTNAHTVSGRCCSCSASLSSSQIQVQLRTWARALYCCCDRALRTQRCMSRCT